MVAIKNMKWSTLENIYFHLEGKLLAKMATPFLVNLADRKICQRVCTDHRKTGLLGPERYARQQIKFNFHLWLKKLVLRA